MAQLNCFLFGEDPTERDELGRLLELTGHVRIGTRLEDCHELTGSGDLVAAELIVAALGEHGDAVLDALEAIAEPRPPIVLVGPSERSDWILRAMRVGAREYLAPDVELAALEQAIETLILTPSVDPDTHVAPLVAVFGAKGGVGTTVVADQLAATLQAAGHSTCLVDLNLRRGDVALHHDVQPSFSLADVARSKGAVDASYICSILEKHSSGLSILAAPRKPEDADLIEADHVERALSLLRTQFDFVIVDLPSEWDDASLRALDMASLLYLVYAFDLPTLAHARDQLELLGRLGVEAERTRMIVNRHNTKGGVQPSEAASFLGRSDDFRIPNDYAAVMDAIATGLPVSKAAPRSALNRVYDELATATLAFFDIEAPVGGDEGRFSKLRKLIGRA